MVSPTAKAAERDRLDDYLLSRRVIAERPLAVLVDGFRFVDQCRAKIEAAWGGIAPARLVYFLSHFHSDHYVGLSPTTARACGVVYTSRVSAALLVSQLHIPPECAFPLDFGPRYCFSLATGQLLGQSGGGSTIDEGDQPVRLPAGVAERDVFYVRLIPANHCPGAAMLLFTSSAFGTILHTGDFRFNGSEAGWRSAVQHGGYFWSRPRPQAQGCSADSLPLPPVPFYETFLEDNAWLRRVAGNVDVLFLDNTFCDPAFRFLSQWQATQGVVETLRSLFESCASEKRRHSRCARVDGEADDVTVTCALLVGTYSIGKERVAFAVQEAFSPLPSCTATAPPIDVHVPIFVTPTKYSLLRSMDFHLQRFQPIASAANVSCKTPHAPAAPPSLTGDEQLPMEDALASGWDRARVSEKKETALPEVVLTSFRVCLPEKVPTTQKRAGNGEAQAVDSSASSPTPGGDVRRSLFEEGSRDGGDAVCPGIVDGDGGRGGEAQGKTHYRLSILLVPLSSLSYPTIAAASGRSLKRDRASDGEAGERVLLGIGDGLGLDLSQFDRVLGVEPTGWARRPKSQRVTDTTWLLKVPYSEHCAFHEMLSFVGFVNPRLVVPTVSAEQFKKHESLFAERAPRLVSRFANTQPLSRFFTTTPKQSRSTGAGDARESGRPTIPSAASARSGDMANELLETKASNPFATAKTHHEGSAICKREGAFSMDGDGTVSGVSPLLSNGVHGAGGDEASQSSTDEGCVVVAVKHAVVEISDDDSL